MPPTRRLTRTVSSTAAREEPQPYSRQANTCSSSASVDRSGDGSKTRLNLTVKAPPSKLRQATSASPPLPTNLYADASESDATPQPNTRVARSTRNPKAVIDEESEEVEEEEEEEEEEAIDEEDEEMGDDIEHDLSGNNDSEEDAEGEDDEEDDEEDEDDDDDEEGVGEGEEMDDHPLRPVIKQMGSKARPQVQVTAPIEGPLKSVEDKEMEDDDDELSELEDDDRNAGGDGEDVDDLDSDEEDLSRGATPDLSKLTKRQRGQYEDFDGGLLALSNEAQKKKHLTAEEHAMRRAEMARRRKNLSEKRNEEEKVNFRIG